MSYAEMSKRYYESDHAKMYFQYRPVPPDTLIKRVVQFLKEKYEGPLNLAIDLGCGSGQCTFKLGSEFATVLGTDLSPAQVSEANESCKKLKCENIKFEVSPAEVIPASDNSAQLITICEAAHWMDMPKVFEEARRVLCPNGVLAIIGYPLPPAYIPTRKEDEGKSDAIKKVVDRAVQVTLDYLPKQALSVFEEYSNITIPFSDFTRESGFASTKTAKLVDIEGCIRAYAPFKTFCVEKGDTAGKELLDSIRNDIISILNEGRGTPMTLQEAEEYDFIASANYFLLIARL